MSLLLIGMKLTHLLCGLSSLKTLGYLLAHFPKVAPLNLIRPCHLRSRKAVRSVFVFFQDGLSSLCVAARRGRDAMVKKLIEARADVNLRGQVSKF